MNDTPGEFPLGFGGRGCILFFKYLNEISLNLIDVVLPAKPAEEPEGVMWGRGLHRLLLFQTLRRIDPGCFYRLQSYCKPGNE